MLAAYSACSAASEHGMQQWHWQNRSCRVQPPELFPLVLDGLSAFADATAHPAAAAYEVGNITAAKVMRVMLRPASSSSSKHGACSDGALPWPLLALCPWLHSPSYPAHHSVCCCCCCCCCCCRTRRASDTIAGTASPAGAAGHTTGPNVAVTVVTTALASTVTCGTAAAAAAGKIAEAVAAAGPGGPMRNGPPALASAARGREQRRHSSDHLLAGTS